jgi:hypothetical protein
MFLRNFDIYLEVHMALQPRITILKNGILVGKILGTLPRDVRAKGMRITLIWILGR